MHDLVPHLVSSRLLVYKLIILLQILFFEAITMIHAGNPICVLDLRRADGEAARWLAAPHPLRSIGSAFSSEAAMIKTIVLPNAFDAVIYVDRTTGSVPVQRSNDSLQPATRRQPPVASHPAPGTSLLMLDIKDHGFDLHAFRFITQMSLWRILAQCSSNDR